MQFNYQVTPNEMRFKFTRNRFDPLKAGTYFDNTVTALEINQSLDFI